MLGSHMIKGWSTTQSVIALSSGEAEYYGLVRGSSIGYRNARTNERLRMSDEGESKHGFIDSHGNNKEERIGQGQAH